MSGIFYTEVFPMNETRRGSARVHHVRNLTCDTYVLRFDRTIDSFAAGQYVSVGVKGEVETREYSIYSAPVEPFVEILVREVEHGRVSRELRRQTKGTRLDVRGPSGDFTLDDGHRNRSRLLFVATGTGISPFHSMVLANPALDYTLLHGVRRTEELYDHDVFDTSRVVSCLTREDEIGDVHGTSFAGRVTDYLRAHPVEVDTRCYLCGNCDMIYETFGILKSQGIGPEQLYAEVYY
jgi:ferredoxin/flavodoxin---NADP+ reductase